jgi:hypothetical protein
MYQAHISNINAIAASANAEAAKSQAKTALEQLGELKRSSTDTQAVRNSGRRPGGLRPRF